MSAKAKFIGGAILLGAIAATLGGCVEPGYGPRRDYNGPERRYKAPRHDRDDNRYERHEDHDDRDRRG